MGPIDLVEQYCTEINFTPSFLMKRRGKVLTVVHHKDLYYLDLWVTNNLINFNILVFPKVKLLRKEEYNTNEYIKTLFLARERAYGCLYDSKSIEGLYKLLFKFQCDNCDDWHKYMLNALHPKSETFIEKATDDDARNQWVKFGRGAY